MIPLILVTGFLGSGKTTLLQRLVERLGERRVAYLINEFAELPVDGEVLQADHDRVVVLAGGSIFCHCLISGFLRELAGLVERFHTADAPLDAVVVEASGMADPRVVDRLLAETRLDQHFRLAQVICLVDPDTLPKLLATLPNAAAQVEAADVVLINKTDVATPEAVARAEAAVRGLNLHAEVRRTAFAADLPPLLPADRAHLPFTGEADYARCADPRYEPVSLTLDGPVDVPALVAAGQAVQADLYRLKGHLTTADGLVFVSYDGARWTVTPTERAVPRTGLAIILRAEAGAAAPAFVAALREGRFGGTTAGVGP